MNTNTELAIPNDIKKEVPTLVAWAKSLTIKDEVDYASAGERLKTIKGMRKRISEFFTPVKRQADAMKRTILNMESELADPAESAETICKTKMLEFVRMQERAAEIERQRLQAIADEQARVQREAAEAEENRQRQLAEAAAERAANYREDAENTDDDDERRRLLKKAEKAETKAEIAAETADLNADRAQAIAAPEVVAAVRVPTVAGIATKKVWKFRVTDASLVPDDYKIIDEKKLGALARAMKGTVKVPGVEFYADDSLSAAGN